MEKLNENFLKFFYKTSLTKTHIYVSYVYVVFLNKFYCSYEQNT